MGEGDPAPGGRREGDGGGLGWLDGMLNIDWAAGERAAAYGLTFWAVALWLRVGENNGREYGEAPPALDV